MSKPATKEPSMDEILSSIRQIIADDDAPPAQSETGAEAPPAHSAGEKVASAPDIPETVDEPLSLSADQIVEQPGGASPEEAHTDPEEARADPEVEAMVADADEDDTPLEIVDPGDIAFDVSGDDDTKADTATVETVEDEPAAVQEPVAVADIAPMPDPELSKDLAEKILAPATDAAVHHTLSRFSALAVGNQGLTLEAMIRDLLRPMLKEWLDENLPATVERLVEKEIERISRGGM